MHEYIPPIVHELVVQARHKNDLRLARAVLVTAGIDQGQLIDDDLLRSPVLKIFSEDRSYIKRIQALFQRIKLPGIKVSSSALRPKQWLTRWKTHWKPARLTKKLDVVPVWYKDKYRPMKGRDYILMDTLLSFGTGLHETTRFVSQFIEDYRGKFRSFIDVGAGTGILTIVALKNGATKVMAVDIGDLSVQAAKDNFKANRVKAAVKLADIKDFKHSTQYDFVAANLVTQDLIDHRHQILKLVKPQGYLAVSGVSLDNLSKLQRSFRQLPLQPLETVKGKKWAGLLYQKKTL